MKISVVNMIPKSLSGESNQDIGRELPLSANTVANDISSILAKLHLDNRIQAAVQAVRSGIA